MIRISRHGAKKFGRAPQKVPGYSIVTLSLKPVGGPPGMPPPTRWTLIADLADKYSFGEIRVGHEQNLALPHVARRDLPVLWKRWTRSASRPRTSILVSDIIACRDWIIARLRMRVRSRSRRN